MTILYHEYLILVFWSGKLAGRTFYLFEHMFISSKQELFSLTNLQQSLTVLAKVYQKHLSFSHNLLRVAILIHVD